jgi:alpha-1,2-mannosyltransferase
VDSGRLSWLRPPLGAEVDSNWLSRRRWPVLVSLGVAGLALAACVDQLAQAHALLGADEYDDGVYLGAALRVVNGAAPYRDFTFLHPPGIIVLLSPLGGLARWTGSRAFTGEARVLTALVASANAGLLAWLVRHRDTPAMLIAGGALAVFPLAVAADHTVLLEPYLVLFCLLGATAMFAGDSLASHKRLVWGGVAFGFAGAVKIWAIFPLAVAIVCCAPNFRRGARPLLFGAAAGFALVCWPFFLLAPTKFVRDTIGLQLDRAPSPGGSLSPGARLLNVTGLDGLPALHATVHGAVIVAVVYIFLVACAYLMPPRPSRLDWFALGSASSTVAAVFLAADFGPHFAYFTATFLALLLTVSCERLIRAASDWSAGRRETRIGRRAAQASRSVVVIVLLVLATLFAEGRLFIREQRWRVNFGDPGPPIARMIPQGACVVTDEPAFSIIADRFVADSSNCPKMVDSFGEWLAADPKHPPPSPGPYKPGLVSAWRSWFSGADYVILTSQFRIPWTPELKSWFASHFKVVSYEGAQVYRARR